MAIDERASAPASAADEYTKPQLSTHVIDLFRSYAWASTGEEINDGLTPFNITFVSETAAKAVAAKVQRLVAVESGGTAMSYADAEIFLKNDASFPGDTASCGYRLAAHSVLVDIMMGPTAPFAVAYRQCIQGLQPHLMLSLKLHYGAIGGGAYHMALRILYWLSQQFLYFLSQRKFNRDPPLPDFPGLLRHLETKTLDGFLGHLPATWLEHIQPTAAGPSGTTKAAAKATAKSDKVRGAHTPVTNTNYNAAIKSGGKLAPLPPSRPCSMPTPLTQQSPSPSSDPTTPASHGCSRAAALPTAPGPTRTSRQPSPLSPKRTPSLMRAGWPPATDGPRGRPRRSCQSEW